MSVDEARQAWAAFRENTCKHCVPPGMYVGGHIPVSIENAACGDAVMGIDGAAHIVKNAVSHGYNGGMRTFTARGTLPFSVTDDHQLLIYPALYHRSARSGWVWRQRAALPGEEPVWRRADEVRVGDFALSPIPRFDGPPPPRRWNDAEACWLIGMLAGDGYTWGREGKRYYAGCVCSRQADVDRAAAVFATWGLKVNIKVSDTFWRLTVCSREVSEEIAGLIGHCSPEKHLPSFVWHSKDLLVSAMDGLMAADGAVMQHRNLENHRLFTTSQVMAWQAWSAAVALGEKPYIRAVKRTSGYANAKPAWTVEWANTTLNNTARTDEFYVMPVVGVVAEQRQGPVHDLTVAETHTFLVNGVLTHNCGGSHPRSCPRVRKLEFHQNGNIASVEFWPPGKWPEAHILWPEDMPDDPDLE